MRGTLEHFAGDGVMVFFNDPVAVKNHELQAIGLALAAQERFAELAQGWRKRGTELGLGIGIEAGYATAGRIGFEGRYDYGALGPVTNLASRLSSRAVASQILIGQRVFAAVEEAVDALPVGELELKGFGRTIRARNPRVALARAPKAPEAHPSASDSGDTSYRYENRLVESQLVLSVVPVVDKLRTAPEAAGASTGPRHKRMDPTGHHGQPLSFSASSVSGVSTRFRL